MEDAAAEAAFRVWELSRLSQGPREVGGGGGAGTSDLYQTNKLLCPVRPHGLQRQAPLPSLAKVRSDLLWKAWGVMQLCCPVSSPRWARACFRTQDMSGRLLKPGTKDHKGLERP